ncbi:MAG: phosphoribosylglycinamide formyltransferase [Muribaculaceae bacterium]|nr:phosphoribosylglycinamide formyltransferase [Muribaculaceae bacterium]
MKRIAVFASGSGTNAEAIARYFSAGDEVQVALLICNRKAAGVFDRIKPFGIPSHYFPKVEWTENEARNVIELLERERIDLVVLAGFLAILPASLINAYHRRIVNIHPSLLPKHGGAGMWGDHVHRAVLDGGDQESGITIHYVSEVIDGGEIIFQAKCPVMPGDTPHSLAERIHPLEHAHFPRIIAQVLSQQ